MEFISKLINPGSAAVVICGAFMICFLGYLLGRISIKVSCKISAGIGNVVRSLAVSIVKHGVSYHGGEVSIKSELGSGTSIKIRFTNKI